MPPEQVLPLGQARLQVAPKLVHVERGDLLQPVESSQLLLELALALLTRAETVEEGSQVATLGHGLGQAVEFLVEYGQLGLQGVVRWGTRLSAEGVSCSRAFRSAPATTSGLKTSRSIVARIA